MRQTELFGVLAALRSDLLQVLAHAGTLLRPAGLKRFGVNGLAYKYPWASSQLRRHAGNAVERVVGGGVKHLELSQRVKPLRLTLQAWRI